jgi:hypothetical protein
LRTLFKARLLDQFPEEAAEAREDLQELARQSEIRENKKKEIKLIIKTRRQRKAELEKIRNNLGSNEEESKIKKII